MSKAGGQRTQLSLRLRAAFKVAAAGAAFVAPSALFANAAQAANLLSSSALMPASFGPIGFAMPWVLASLAATLPAVWYLSRQTPPSPRVQYFPALELLKGLPQKEEKPAQIPWWHLLMRMAAVATITAGLAQPSLNPTASLEGAGPVVMVVDNDWAAASQWEARLAEMTRLIERAEKDGREIVIVPTAPLPDQAYIQASKRMTADEARVYMESLAPHPWEADRAAAAQAVDLAGLDTGASVIWLSNGLDQKGTDDLLAQLQKLGAVNIWKDAPDQSPVLLSRPYMNGGEFSLDVQRADASVNDVMILHASGADGRVLDSREVAFEAGQAQVRVTYDLSPELRAQILRITVSGEQSAGATLLLDEQWRNRPVGLVENAGGGVVSPLLTEHNYIERALQPYTDLHRGTVEALLDENLAVLVLGDAASLDDDARTKLDDWIRGGGTVLRFAGPHMAASDKADSLLPVELRPGNRQLGGGMIWGEPARVAPFDQSSPFYGLRLPADLVVERQVLAQPGGDDRARIWARLEDGTPLVSAEPRGDGYLILVHTTASPAWSNLALSGLFVDMLRAVVDHSNGVSGAQEQVLAGGLPAWKVLDAKGRLVEPGAHVNPLHAAAINDRTIGPHQPPGLYGNDSAMRAYNLEVAVERLRALTDLPENTTVRHFATARENRLAGPLYGVALALLMGDMLLQMRGARRGAAPATPKRAAPSP